jgi:hypothetical protein
MQHFAVLLQEQYIETMSKAGKIWKMKRNHMVDRFEIISYIQEIADGYPEWPMAGRIWSVRRAMGNDLGFLHETSMEK